MRAHGAERAQHVLQRRRMAIVGQPVLQHEGCDPQLRQPLRILSALVVGREELVAAARADDDRGLRGAVG
ncbi:conserved hypothetical protein [Ricinus communis]|uniref:Uncharacterized protein n=1 Tax=Ricinus communis TaxID=3988 RepID=B9TBT7_RICCO|nr:conserved hypothetical protein [Ricinus communis]